MQTLTFPAGSFLVAWENSNVASSTVTDYQTVIQVQHARNAAGHIHVAKVSNPNADTFSGQLDFIRYDDADPPNAIHTTSVETSGVTSVDFALAASNRIYMVYCKSDTLYFAESKNGGDTFSTPTQINIQTDIVSCCWDGDSGFLVVLNQSLPNAHTQIMNGTILDDKVTWSFTSPMDLNVFSADNQIMIRRSADGSLHYIQYRTGVNHYWTPKFAADTTATWSTQSAITDNTGVIWEECFSISPIDGMFVVAGYDLHAAAWKIVIGLYDTSQHKYVFSNAVSTNVACYFCDGSVARRKDGSWEIATYDVVDNTFKFLRCKALVSNATGAWSF